MRYLKYFKENYGYSYKTILKDFYNYLWDLKELRPELTSSIDRFRTIIDRKMLAPVDIVEKNIFFKNDEDLYNYIEGLVFKYLKQYPDKNSLRDEMIARLAK